MEKVKRFEELLIWQNSRQLSKEIYTIFKDKNQFCDRPLSNQIIRSSSSVMDNIAEGFERGGNKEFLQYLWISKASAGECRSQLYRAFDTEIIDEKQFNDLKIKIESLSIGLYKFISTIKQSGFKGQKYV
jgi:four helix bundle protein